MDRPFAWALTEPENDCPRVCCPECISRYIGAGEVRPLSRSEAGASYCTFCGGFVPRVGGA